MVVDQLAGNYAHLSMQKFSSNVVERCLKIADEDQRTCIIRELMEDSRLLELLQDPFANYVIQSALIVSKVSCKFLFTIRCLFINIQTYKHASPWLATNVSQQSCCLFSFLGETGIEKDNDDDDDQLLFAAGQNDPRDLHISSIYVVVLIKTLLAT